MTNTPLVITYDPNYEGICVPDGKVKQTAQAIIDLKMQTNIVSQEAVIMALCVLVKQGAISHRDIAFVYNDQMILVDRFGHLDQYLDGFCDTCDKMLVQLIEL